MNAFDNPPEVRIRREGDLELAARLWRFADPMLAISSAPLGGGLGLRHWVCNVQVPPGYDCDDPQRDLVTLMTAADVSGPGAGMMTAVNVRDASIVRREAVYVDATVGVSEPQWAAADETLLERSGPPRPTAAGTINMVIALPERLSDGALVNAISTATEAKTQALWEAGVGGTGTATDALCILCPAQGPAQAYGGPRSTWGARVARAVRLAVLCGCTRTGSG